MSFLDENYLLSNPSARELYREVEDLPIIDPHNHADVPEIVANRYWNDIWQVEGATDHYVWELMRRRGVSEESVTGSASNRDKWRALCGKFPEMIGNPTYEWVHLDLKRRFGIDELISAATADALWEQTRQQLQSPEMSPHELLKSMKVEIMCTTDDPTLSLPAHEEAQQSVPHTSIVPTWRPDRAMNIEKPSWRPFVESLCSEAGEDPSNLSGLHSALEQTHRYFKKLGCVASDHGLTQPYGHRVGDARARQVYEKAISGAVLDEGEIRDFKAYMLHAFAELDAAEGWVMQLHIGPVRDYRDRLREELGPDTGGDILSLEVNIVENLRELLNACDGRLKVVLYCVDPAHLPTLATLARAFPNLTLGAPWWWNDSPYGMESQLKYIATVDLLSNHAGMVTDSRKLISFGSRTEMFRRILCNVVGDMVRKGQVPETPALDLVKSLSYHRPHEVFFG